MRRFALRPEEDALMQRAADWIDRIEVGLDKQHPGITPRDSLAQGLQRLDRACEVWRRACRRGWHDYASARETLFLMRELHGWERALYDTLLRRARP